MKKFSLADFQGGWFLGDFTPTLFETSEFEVAIKYYRAGDAEPSHLHKVATEWTVITSGEVEMNGIRHVQGDIIELKPGEASDFRAITDTVTTVVKIPSVKGDKYLQ